MSFGRTLSVVIVGIEGVVVDVEASVAPGLPRVVISGLPDTISGLPDTAVQQAPNRLRSAMTQSELVFPDQRLTINLAPASLQKSGAGLDLAMAVSILCATRTIDSAEAGKIVHLGELGMDGTVRPVLGVLPACVAARDAGLTELIVPAANAAEAALVEGLRVHPARTLSDGVAFHQTRARGGAFEMPWPTAAVLEAVPDVPDMADVVGQYEARAAMEVAAAGGHNVSMIGPPGAGKTLLASRLPGILPPLTHADALTVTSIHSILGTLGRRPLVERAPFVSPHHGTTMPALIGGGSGRPRPGAISQAHAGVLFLDEAQEFRREVLDALRQPLESGYVTVARTQQVVRFPCRFQLVLASNPCPCGRLSGTGAACTCTVQARRTYTRRLSGPLMDRIDVHLQVPSATRADLMSGPGESSAAVSARVLDVRERSRRRWRDLDLMTNAQVPGTVLRSSPWALDARDVAVLDQALDTGSLTLRGYDRILRLAWNLADLRGIERPTKDDIYTALTLREGAVAA